MTLAFSKKLSMKPSLIMPRLPAPKQSSKLRRTNGKSNKMNLNKRKKRTERNSSLKRKSGRKSNTLLSKLRRFSMLFALTLWVKIENTPKNKDCTL